MLSIDDDHVGETLVAVSPNTKELLTESKCILLHQSGLSGNSITHTSLIPFLPFCYSRFLLGENYSAFDFGKGALHWLAPSLQISRYSCNTVSHNQLSCLHQAQWCHAGLGCAMGNVCSKTQKEAHWRQALCQCQHHAWAAEVG